MYDSLAQFYDLFMKQVDYEAIGAFAKRELIGCKRGADLGCGSGKTTLVLNRNGFDVVGVDCSEQMLLVAQENARKTGVCVPFIKGKAEKIKFPRPLDFLTAFCDVLNYVTDLDAFFQNAFKNLKEGGVLLFDVSSEYKLRTILGNNTYTDEEDGVLYVWSNEQNGDYVYMNLSFFRKEKDGRYARYDESQRQKAHSAQAILFSLTANGFEDARVYGGINGEPATDRSERLYFTAKKRKRNEGNDNTQL